MIAYRRLPLRGLHNCRDLGGYPAPGGRTRFGVFIRAEAPCNLPGADLGDLLVYGATTAVDLRSAGELAVRPSDMADDWRFTYIHLPLIGKLASYSGEGARVFRGWGPEYIEMAEQGKEWAVQAMELAAGTKGGLFYHCTTGKDRTGIMSALLLSIAGVSAQDIVSDYSVSELYLQPVYQRMRDGVIRLGASAQKANFDMSPESEFFRTAAGNMFALLEHFETAYGGVIGYLRHCGVSEHTMQTIRGKFVESV